MRLLPGHRIGPYEVQSLLGAGGMGEVYVAHDPRLHRTVAIKVLSAVGLFLRRAWGRWIEQGLAALALLVFPFGTVLGTAALGYLDRSGMSLFLSGRQSRDFTPQERAVVERNVQVPRKWIYALPALALGTTIPIGAVMAISIPSLLRARIASNEAGAVAHRLR